MPRSIYYVHPMADFPTYFTAENFAGRGLGRAISVADLATPTIAALTPPEFHVTLCDENIHAVDFDSQADFIAITGKITQHGRMVSIAREFRKRGKTVLIGGPHASLSPELLRPHCDILVRGEIEELAPQLFADLLASAWKDDYVGDRPDLSISPVPRWDLYPNDRSLIGTLQTSRGCPFECEFCDVIQYAGRKQRHKPTSNVVRELDELYAHGYRNVFLADDNFTVYRSRAKELLLAIRDWNRNQTRGEMSFTTQLSIDAARDDELLTLCAEAGLTNVFIGLETPNEESLKETKKRQNLHVDLVEQVGRFFEHGISVTGGMIVGFDADSSDIFGRQYEFAMASAIPIFSLGALVAPAATPLYARMEKLGRLKQNGSETPAIPWTTNIIHPKMSEDELVGGIKWLTNSLYTPAAFGERLFAFIKKFRGLRDPGSARKGPNNNLRGVDRDTMDILHKFRRLGKDEAKLWERVMDACSNKPEATPGVFLAITQYMQIRYMYDKGSFWEPQLATAPAPAPIQPLTTLRVPERTAGA
jgi:radical SAM superfamily enzyme YgiQ (UPF0313 family)